MHVAVLPEVSQQCTAALPTEDWCPAGQNAELPPPTCKIASLIHNYPLAILIPVGDMQAMDAREAREMLQASQENPHLTAMIVPSPASLPWDATLSNILKAGSLGDLVYIEVLPHPPPLSQPCHSVQPLRVVQPDAVV